MDHEIFIYPIYKLPLMTFNSLVCNSFGLIITITLCEATPWDVALIASALQTGRLFITRPLPRRRMSRPRLTTRKDFDKQSWIRPSRNLYCTCAPLNGRIGRMTCRMTNWIIIKAQSRRVAILGRSVCRAS